MRCQIKEQESGMTKSEKKVTRFIASIGWLKQSWLEQMGQERLDNQCKKTLYTTGFCTFSHCWVKGHEYSSLNVLVILYIPEISFNIKYKFISVVFTRKSCCFFCFFLLYAYISQCRLLSFLQEDFCLCYWQIFLLAYWILH